MVDINELKFDEKGLIPAIVVDSVSKRVLTLAYKLCLPCGGLESSFLPFERMAFIAFWSVCAVSFPVLM